MATDPGTIDHLLDQLGRRGAVFSTRRMFGEYCLYRDGLPVALVCDDTLFVKDTPAGRDAVAATMTPEFGPPYPGAKPHLQLSPDVWDDGDWLRRVLDVTAAALPPAKVKGPKNDHAPASRSAEKRTERNVGNKTPAAAAPKRSTKTTGAAKKVTKKRAATKKAAPKRPSRRST